ncbi:MAG: DUF58 domain-containing protein [Tepidisphaeraceae bacterium]|jgi:uncharacterized protein (DUF58 family)
MPVHRYKYFTPSDAARVGRLQFMAKQVVEGIITGLHKSPHQGFSVEFSEHRKYVPGDELRHLDWKVFARSDRHYIKLYEQETNLRATIVLDNSASMIFAGKIEYARHLAACLAYLLATQQDLAGLAAIDDSIRVEISAGSTPAHLDRLFTELEKLQPGKGTDLASQLHGLAERLPRRSLLFLITDLWIDPRHFARALQHLRHRQHQAIVLHLLDKQETEFPFDRRVTFQDLETDEKIQIDPADLRQEYLTQVKNYLTEVRRACSDSEVEYEPLFVDQPYDAALVRWLNARK